MDLPIHLSIRHDVPEELSRVKEQLHRTLCHYSWLARSLFLPWRDPPISGCPVICLKITIKGVCERVDKVDVSGL